MLFLHKNVCCEFSRLWFEPHSGHMWESQVLLMDGQVVFPRVLTVLAHPLMNNRLNSYIRPYYRTYPQPRNLVIFKLHLVYFYLLLYEGICYWYLFELPQQVEAIQMSTNNMLLRRKLEKILHKYH